MDSLVKHLAAQQGIQQRWAFKVTPWLCAPLLGEDGAPWAEALIPADRHGGWSLLSGEVIFLYGSPAWITFGPSR